MLIQVTIPSSANDDIQELSKHVGMSRSAFVRCAVLRYIAEMKQNVAEHGPFSAPKDSTDVK